MGDRREGTLLVAVWLHSFMESPIEGTTGTGTLGNPDREGGGCRRAHGEVRGRRREWELKDLCVPADGP